MKKSIIYIIYFIIFNIYIIFIEIQSLFLQLKRFTNSIVLRVKHSSDINYLRKTATILQKLPVHLAIVINEEDLEQSLEEYLKDLSNFVCWAISIGTHYITLYDPKGNSFSDFSVYFQW